MNCLKSRNQQLEPAQLPFCAANPTMVITLSSRRINDFPSQRSRKYFCVLGQQRVQQGCSGPRQPGDEYWLRDSPEREARTKLPIQLKVKAIAQELDDMFEENTAAERIQFGFLFDRFQ